MRSYRCSGLLARGPGVPARFQYRPARNLCARVRENGMNAIVIFFWFWGFVGFGSFGPAPARRSSEACQVIGYTNTVPPHPIFVGDCRTSVRR